MFFFIIFIISFFTLAMFVYYAFILDEFFSAYSDYTEKKEFLKDLIPFHKWIKNIRDRFNELN